MRVIPVNELQPGMILARPIYSEKDGLVLLQSRIELKPTYIEKIKELGYSFVLTLEKKEIDLPEELPEQLIKNETRAKTISVLKTSFNQLQQHHKIDVTKIRAMVKDLVEEILSHNQAIYNLSKLRDYDNYTYVHSVNVCILSVLTGSLLGYNRIQLENLAIGALLHDIGKMAIDNHLLNKTAKLNHDEYEILKKHTFYGYEQLKKILFTSFLPAHIAYQHHEREDGSGYPRKLTGKKIHRYAKIVAIADTFDAMTTDRSYQKAISPYSAIQKITEEAGKFDKNILDCFIKVIAPYPIGSLLILSDNQKVVVFQVTREKCIVQSISGESAGRKFDLHSRPDLSVIEYIQT